MSANERGLAQLDIGNSPRLASPRHNFLLLYSLRHSCPWPCPCVSKPRRAVGEA